MLADAGASAVIVGHSERRTDHHETDAEVRAKAEAAWRAKLVAIVCVGETREHREVGDTLKVVGTYRALPPHQAARIGRLYAESEFDVSRLTHLRPKMVEVGRSCVHPDYRSGAVIMSLWAGLAAYMKHNGYETMLGCASVAMVDGGHYAANLYCALRDTAMTAPEYHAFPHTPLPVDELRTGADVAPPPLVKGYLRLGAKICGAPAWDPDFNCADFLTLLRLSEINARYARHFLGDAASR